VLASNVSADNTPQKRHQNKQATAERKENMYADKTDEIITIF